MVAPVLNESIKLLIERILNAKGTLEPWEIVEVADITQADQSFTFSLVWFDGDSPLWHGGVSNAVEWSEKFRDDPIRVIDAFKESVIEALVKGRPIAEAELAKRRSN
jgi:hypothetical protein